MRLGDLGWAGVISHETSPSGGSSEFGTLGLHPTPVLVWAVREQVASLLPSQGQCRWLVQCWGGELGLPASLEVVVTVGVSRPQLLQLLWYSGSGPPRTKTLTPPCSLPPSQAPLVVETRGQWC